MTTPIKEIIAEMREKAKAATQGEWAPLIGMVMFTDPQPKPGYFIASMGCELAISCHEQWNSEYGKPYENIEFIVFARNNIPAILDYVEKLEEQVKLYQGVLEFIESCEAHCPKCVNTVKKILNGTMYDQTKNR